MYKVTLIFIFLYTLHAHAAKKLPDAIISNDIAGVEALLQMSHSIPPLVVLYELYRYHRTFNLEAMIRIFLKYNTDITSTSPKKLFTPLHYAASLGQTRLIDEFISRYPPAIRSTMINEQDIFKKTALHYAVMHGHTNAARMLLHYGAKTNIKDDNDETAQFLAQQSKISEIRTLFRLTLIYGKQVTTPTMSLLAAE